MSENDFSGILIPDKNTLTYNGYLKIPELLQLQIVQSTPPEHDELLFIIIHQVYELWFKQTLHELDECSSALKADQPLRCMKALKRIDRIQGVLIHQIDILETMTPSDFNRFRERLNPASGFQSHQFRVFEFRLGLKDSGYKKFFKSQPKALEALQSTLLEPSVYDDVLHFLSRNGYKIPNEVLNRDVSTMHISNPAVVQEFVGIYQDNSSHYEAYMLLEALLDLDEKLEIWRYRHVAMVKRMIGLRTGTGGSSGAKYLNTTLSKRCFPEILEVRDHLTSASY
jgi:tryptophan 2,3-dioxygenase